jgi:hypothetical protein
MKTNKWIQDLKNSTKDQGIKDDINKLTNTIETLGAIHQPSQHDRELLSDAGQVNLVTRNSNEHFPNNSSDFDRNNEKDLR